MPYLQMPDGRYFKYGDNVSFEDAAELSRKQFPKAWGEEVGGIKGMVGRGLESLLSSAQTGYEALTGAPEEAGKAGAVRQKALGEKYKEEIGLDLLKKRYEEEGLLGGAKEIIRQAPLAIAEQAPNLGATLAAGRAGAMAGGVFGPVGAVVGGLGGAAIPSLIQQFGGNIERQVAEGQPVSVGSALGAAVPQAGLDVAGSLLPFGRTLIGKALGPTVEQALTRGAGEAAERLAQESLKKSLAKGLGVGALAEIPTEITQQMLERYQAGLPLTSEDALVEYGNTAYQAGLLAPIGAAGRVVDRGAARKDIAEKQAAEAEAQATAAEQARLASPAYFDELTEQQAKIQEQLANMEYGLGRAKKDEAKARLQERIDAKQNELADVQARLTAHPLFAERQAKAEEQAQTTKTLGMFGEWQQQAQADLAAKEQRAAMGMPEAVQTLPGMEQVTPVPTPQLPDINAARAERDTLAAQLEQLQNQMAQAAVAGNTAAIPELRKQIDTLTPAVSELDKLIKADPAAQLARLNRALAKAGAEGDFDKITKLADEIEALKAQGVTLPEIPTYDQGQQRLFTREGTPTAEAKRGVRLGEEAQTAEAERALEQEQQDLLGLGYTRKYKSTPEERIAKEFEGYKASLDELEEAYKANADERMVGRLVDLFQKGGAKEEASAEIADRSLQPQQSKFRSQEAGKAAQEAYANFSEALENVRDGYFFGGKNTKLASSTRDGLLRQADKAKRDYIEAVLQQVDNDRLANRHNSLTQGQALQLAMQIHTAMDRNLKAGTVEPQLEQHLKQYAQPFYKPTTQKAFGLTMQTEKSLAKKVAREEAPKEIVDKTPSRIERTPYGEVRYYDLKDHKVAIGRSTSGVVNSLEFDFATKGKLEPFELGNKYKRVEDMTDEQILDALVREGVADFKTVKVAPEKELTDEEKAVRREAMRTEEGGKGVQKTLPGIEPIATERATPANFMKFLNSAEVAKLRRNVEAEKAKEAEAIRAEKAAIQKDQAKYEALKTKVEVETGKLREAIADITELDRKDAVYVAEQKLNEAIKKAEQEYMQGMEVLGPVINQAQRELAAVESNVTVAADRAVATRLRDWLNQAYDLRDKYADRVEALRKSRVRIDEHKVRRDAILSDYIQKRKKALDKLEAEIKAKPKGVAARKADEERARLGAAEAKLKERNEAQTKLRREREQAAREFDNATKSYGQKVETAMVWDPNLGEFVEAVGKKGEVIRRKVVSAAPKSAETKREELRASQKESARERIQTRKNVLEQKLEGSAMTADRVAAELDAVAKMLKDKKLPVAERKAAQQRQRDLKEYEKLIKVGRQLVRIEEAPPRKRGELRAARQERTEPQAKGEAPEVIGKATQERIKELGAEYKSLVGSIEERWGGDLLDEIGDLGYAIMDQVRGSAMRDGGAKVNEGVDLKAFKSSTDKVSAKLAKSGIKLRYYDTVDQAPAIVKAALAYHKADTTKGLILPDGSLTVIGDTHANMRDLEETIAHEVIGHYGVEGMLGAKGVQELTDKIFETDGLVYRVADALGVWDEVRATEQSAIARGLNTNQQRVAMVRELIAHTAEKRGVPAGMVDTMKRWIKALVNTVRNWFGRNGMDAMTKATSAEIQKLVMEAEKAYIKNELPAYVSPSGQVAFRSKIEYAPSYNPELIKIANNVFAKNQTLKDKIKANATGLNFAIQFVDRFAGLEAVAKQMKDQLAAFQMMYWNRSYDARNMVVAETATNGPRIVKDQKRPDGKVEKVLAASGAPGLKDIAEEVGKSAKRVGNANAALQQFGLYLVAKRAKRVGIDVAFGRNSSMTPAQLDDIIRNGDADLNFKKAAGMYAEYNKGLMDFLKQTGAISDKEFNDLTKYGDYVGFYREKNGVIVDGEHNITIGDLTHNKFLKELLGSDQAIIDFQSSALQNTSLVTDIGLRNLATKNTAYTLRDLGMAKVLDGTGPAKDNIVRFKEHGRDKYAVIDDAMGVPGDLLVKSMEGISTSLPTAIRFMQGPANLLRKGVTRMPLYAVRQIIRDSMASTMTAGVDAMPVTSALKQMGSLIKGTNKTERKLQEKGLIGGQVFSATPDDMKLILQDIAAGKDHWTTLMSKLDHLAMKADAASRVTAYNSYVKQGMSDMEASLAALEMMNFTKRGLSPNMLLASNMIPFFNAQVQGLNVLVKAFRGTGLFQNKLDIKSKLLKRGAMMAAISMLYAAMMGDDEAYKNATPEEKYNNWFVYLPGLDEPVRVPIPFEIGYIFKALPELVYNMALGDEKAGVAAKAFRQMAINTIPGGSNMLLPQALKPAVEVAANYSFFTGKPIEGARMMGVEPSKRYGIGTSELAKAMGDLLGVSPTQIDYLVRGYTGGLGAALVATLNPLLASPEKPSAPEKKMSELAFIGQAFQPTDGRGVINEAYDTMQRINQAKGTYNKLLEDGLLKEAEQFAKDNAELVSASSAAGKFRQRMGDLAKTIRQIQGDPTMSPKDKRAAIDAIKQEQIALAKQLRSIE